MKFLKKVVVAIVLVILLSLAKTLLIRHLEASQFFFVNLVGCLQLMILCWAVITGAIESIPRIGASRQSAKISFVIFIALTLLGELFFYALLHRPRHIPQKLLSSCRYFYNNCQRNIMQFDTSCAKYDSSLFYTLKPKNRCVFGNIEFVDGFASDARGFRNAADTPLNSQVICLGDSYTIGWGVQEQETYVHQLAGLLHLPVLNTGMSSYGTAREVYAVQQIGADSPKVVVIQYCYNDDEENESFAANGNRLKISSRAVYDSACRSLAWSRLYFPGKYLFTVSKIFFKQELDAWKNRRLKNIMQNDYQHSAALFVNVLKSSGWNFSKTRVVVFSIGEFESLNDGFINALDRQLRIPENMDWTRGHIQTLPVAKLLNPSDYYILDAHIRPSGHIKIAQAIADLLLRNNVINR